MYSPYPLAHTSTWYINHFERKYQVYSVYFTINGIALPLCMISWAKLWQRCLMNLCVSMTLHSASYAHMNCITIVIAIASSMSSAIHCCNCREGSVDHMKCLTTSLVVAHYSSSLSGQYGNASSYSMDVNCLSMRRLLNTYTSFAARSGVRRLRIGRWMKPKLLQLRSHAHAEVGSPSPSNFSREFGHLPARESLGSIRRSSWAVYRLYNELYNAL